MLQLRKSPTRYTFSLSLLIHIALLMIIGGSVVVTIHHPPHQTSVINPFPPDDFPKTEEPEPEPPEPVGQSPLVNPVEIPSSPTNIEPTSAPFAVTTENPIALLFPQGGPGDRLPAGTFPNGKPGRPDGNPTQESTKKIKLWQNEIADVNKLGVILDVSGSAHPFLAAAIREVEKNFDHNPTLLVMGCGMNPTLKESEVKVELLGRSKPDKVKDKAGSRSSLGQLAMAEANIKGFGSYLDRFRKRDDVWQVAGGDVGATQFAFEKLIGEGVDTIYWFADFQDKVDSRQMDELTRLLKKKGIRVIAHNFSGKPVPADQSRMAKESGGQTIALIPK